MPMQGHLGLGAWDSQVRFSSARLRMISGHASADASVAGSASPQVAAASPSSDKPGGAAKFPLNQWVDVLPLIDTARDTVKGIWTSNGKELVCEPAEHARIAVPVIIRGGYDLEVEFTRSTGNADVATMLSVGSHPCIATLSGWGGSISALMYVNGHEGNDSANPITVRPGSLENGHRYRVLIRARVLANNRGSVDLSLDGKPYLPHWEGDLTALSQPDSRWGMPDPQRFGFGAYNAHVTFHSIRLRMISGHATDDSATAGPPSAGSPTNSNRPAIVKARWGRRETWVDVTAVVQEAVAKGEVVYANSGFLKVDPTEGRKKQLQITFKLGDTEQAANINEGGKWSQDDYEHPKP
jgi:hypothetical protein